MKSNHIAILLIFGLCALFLTSCGDDEISITVDANDFSLSIDENPTNGQVIGTVPGSTNEGALTYTILSQNPSGAIALDNASGEVTVADASLFDYEERTSISVTVNVANGDVSQDVTATITINDVSESDITYALTNNDKYNNSAVYTDNSKLKFGNSNSPFVIIDGYNADNTYELKLTGAAFGQNYTIEFSSVTNVTPSGAEDPAYYLLYFNSSDKDLKSDYYYAELLEVETGESFTVKTQEGEDTRFVDTDGSDYWGDIQLETNNWVPKDTVFSKTDFRMRPLPKVTNTAGKLYFYDTNMNELDSLRSTGASGSSSGGVTYWYSLKFRGVSGADDMNVSSTGNYKVSFIAPDGRKSPVHDIYFVKED